MDEVDTKIHLNALRSILGLCEMEYDFTLLQRTEPMKLNPVEDRIIIKPIEADEVTPGGIVLPDNARKKPNRGIVVAVGPGRLLENGTRSELLVEVGDEVMYGEYSGAEFEVDGEIYRIVREQELFAIVTKD
jgi:chaperonin GroES